MNDVTLCLLDCSGIQNFVFGSNKLKTNIGASYLVEKVFNVWLEDALLEVFDQDSSKFCLDKWDSIAKNKEADCKDYERIWLKENGGNGHLQMEIGFIGGGTALLLFRKNGNENYAEEFIKTWTQRLLVHAPGLRPVLACCDGLMDNLAPDIEKVFGELQKNKNEFLAETTVARHGVTAECNITGLSTEIRKKINNIPRYISAVAHAKIIHEDETTDSLSEKYAGVIDDYAFGNDIEKLGQSENVENHIAIVHIDGNRMGERFKCCAELKDKRSLSRQVKEAVEEAMSFTLNALIEKLCELEKDGLALTTEAKTGKNVLPLRPIVVNGDDVTFVADARLGFFLAETYIMFFEKQKIQTGISEVDKPLTACGGVAITRTKYPFYRGYEMAEVLCDKAKEKSREHEDTSWLDFHISYRGLPASIDDMRRQQYKVGADRLSWRPWQISGTEARKSLRELKTIIKKMAHEKQTKWPRSKRKQLVEILSQGPGRTQEFLDTIAARGLTLYGFDDYKNLRKTGWLPVDQHQETPYYDILEIMELYPECLL